MVPYLNRLSDLVWTMARWQEHGESLLSRGGAAGPMTRTPLRGGEPARRRGRRVLGVPVFADLTAPDRRRGRGRPGLPGPAAVRGPARPGPGGAGGRRLHRGGLGRGPARPRRCRTPCAGPGRRWPARLAPPPRWRPPWPRPHPDPDLVAAAVEGIGLGAYRFEGARKPPRPGRLERVLVVAPRARSRGRSDGPRWKRPSGEARSPSTPPGGHATGSTARPRDLTPTELARVAEEAAAGTGVTVEVWDEDRIRAERLGGLLGVAAGAAEPPRLLRLVYEPPPGDRDAWRWSARGSPSTRAGCRSSRPRG